jgi:hypothetical protein
VNELSPSEVTSELFAPMYNEITNMLTFARLSRLFCGLLGAVFVH